MALFLVSHLVIVRTKLLMVRYFNLLAAVGCLHIALYNLLFLCMRFMVDGLNQCLSFLDFHLTFGIVESMAHRKRSVHMDQDNSMSPP